MALPECGVFTIEQIASRWRVDREYVRILVAGRGLPQAYIVHGPARILMPAAAGGFQPHPQTLAKPFQIRVTVSTLYSMPSLTRWPLRSIIRVSDYSGSLEPSGPSLLQFRRFDQVLILGWILDFDSHETA
ncbi:MAG: hypothetical protein OSA97_04115, partial [Nevskia sp.]|nr:hypothetical protein [Nevskia sp.]